MGLGVTLLLLLLHGAVLRANPARTRVGGRRGAEADLNPVDWPADSPRPAARKSSPSRRRVAVAAEWQSPPISRETRKLLLFPGDSDAPPLAMTRRSAEC